MSAIPMKDLLEAGVHFGHQTKRWNPKMKKYIFGKRNGIYIIDLQKTLKCFREAAAYVTEAASQGKNVLFVGTKRQAQDAIDGIFLQAQRLHCAQYVAPHVCRNARLVIQCQRDSALGNADEFGDLAHGWHRLSCRESLRTNERTPFATPSVRKRPAVVNSQNHRLLLCYEAISSQSSASPGKRSSNESSDHVP